MNSPERKDPVLYSEIKGTAFDEPPKYNWQRLLLNDLSPKAGFSEFIQGAAEWEVNTAGFISDALDVKQRRAAVGNAINKLGKNWSKNTILAGQLGSPWLAKQAKAERIVAEARKHTVLGFIDVRPDVVGSNLAKVLAAEKVRGIPVEPVHIIIGAVIHRQRDNYLHELNDVFHSYDPTSADEISLTIGESTVTAVRLGPLGPEAGHYFASNVRDATLRE